MPPQHTHTYIDNRCSRSLASSTSLPFPLLIRTTRFYHRATRAPRTTLHFVTVRSQPCSCSPRHVCPRIDWSGWLAVDGGTLCGLVHLQLLLVCRTPFVVSSSASYCSACPFSRRTSSSRLPLCSHRQQSMILLRTPPSPPHPPPRPHRRPLLSMRTTASSLRMSTSPSITLHRPPLLSLLS